MNNQYFLQKVIILAIGFSLMGCITTAPKKTNGEQVNLEQVQTGDNSLACSEISKQMSDIDRLLIELQANTVDNATKAVVTQVGTQVASGVALSSAYQMVPGGAQYLPQLVAIGSQYFSGLQQNDQQIASRAGIRKNYLVGLYNQKACDRKSSVVRNTQVHDAQIYLNKLGYHCGSPDGIMGGKTLTAVQNYQKNSGMPVNGQVTPSLVKELKNAVAKVTD